MNSGDAVAGFPLLVRNFTGARLPVGAGLSQRLPPLSDSVSRFTEKPKNLRRDGERLRIGNVVIGNCRLVTLITRPSDQPRHAI